MIIVVVFIINNSLNSLEDLAESPKHLNITLYPPCKLSIG